ncbi:MAG TPA: universal stress protein [Nitrospiraceae bacterium]|nr:universal stress protein [Nitrospiraceae bacterium]
MKILLAVDGSDHSYEAARALRFFSRAEAVTVLHVLDVPKPAYPMMMPEVARELYVDLEQSMKEEGERLLDRIRSLLPMDSGPVTKQLVVGSPAEMIAKTVESAQTDLIIMGARGLGPVKERLFGSVSHRVLTMASCAKLIVNGPIQSMRQILLPLQGQPDAEAATRFLRFRPFRDPVEIAMLTVLPPTRAPWPVGAEAAGQLEQRALQSARHFIDDVADRLGALGYQAKGSAALGSPAATILEETEKLRPDLILMGSSGRSGLTRFVLGSVAHAMLHQNRCPVLAFE